MLSQRAATQGRGPALAAIPALSSCCWSGAGGHFRALTATPHCDCRMPASPLLQAAQEGLHWTASADVCAASHFKA